MCKCGCEYHLKMTELIVTLQKWRRVAHKKIKQSFPDHECDACSDIDKYLGFTKDLSTFTSHVCPCEKGCYHQRQLACAKGICVRCKNVRDVMSKCTAERDVMSLIPPVKYKWLRAIQIGGRNDTEWAYMTKPYPEFEDLLVSYFEETYRLHNWVYKRQVNNIIYTVQRVIMVSNMYPIKIIYTGSRAPSLPANVVKRRHHPRS